MTQARCVSPWPAPIREGHGKLPAPSPSRRLDPALDPRLISPRLISDCIKLSYSKIIKWISDEGLLDLKSLFQRPSASQPAWTRSFFALQLKRTSPLWNFY